MAMKKFFSIIGASKIANKNRDFLAYYYYNLLKALNTL